MHSMHSRGVGRCRCHLLLLLLPPHGNFCCCCGASVAVTRPPTSLRPCASTSSFRPHPPPPPLSPAPLRSHFLAFKKPSYNKLLALFGNLPLVVPVAKKFREYHHDHHIFLVRPGLVVEGGLLEEQRVPCWWSARCGGIVYTLPPLPSLACRALTAATSTCPPCSSPTGSPASSPRWGAAVVPAVAAVWLGHTGCELQLCVCRYQTCSSATPLPCNSRVQQLLHQGPPFDSPPSPLPPLQLFFTFIYLSIYAVRPLVVRPKAVSESGGRRLGCAGPTSGVDVQEWLQHAVACRCRLATVSLVELCKRSLPPPTSFPDPSRFPRPAIGDFVNWGMVIGVDVAVLYYW